MTFSVYRSLFTVRYPFTVFSGEWLMDNGKCMVNGKWRIVNASRKNSTCAA